MKTKQTEKFKYKISSCYATEREWQLISYLATRERRPLNNFVKNAVMDYIERNLTKEEIDIILNQEKNEDLE